MIGGNLKGEKDKDIDGMDGFYIQYSGMGLQRQKRDYLRFKLTFCSPKLYQPY